CGRGVENEVVVLDRRAEEAGKQDPAHLLRTGVIDLSFRCWACRIGSTAVAHGVVLSVLEIGCQRLVALAEDNRAATRAAGPKGMTSRSSGIERGPTNVVRASSQASGGE